MTLSVGAKLGPYEILGPVGAGGMGEVYRARDTRLNRTVAIKVLPAHLSSNPELKQRLEREARAISSLNHPHICTLYDIGTHDGMDFLVMEYLEGETLADQLQKGSLPIENVLKTATEISDALDKAHRQGILHRDLKPANIMLTKSGAKLLDFGLAKLKKEPMEVADALTEMTAEIGKLTREGMLVGTFQYMAPEQLEGKDADRRTDIFAFGAVLFEMATGCPAFTAKSRCQPDCVNLDRRTADDFEPATNEPSEPRSGGAEMLGEGPRRTLAERKGSQYRVAMDRGAPG